MGEYAKFGGREVKIGTCEDMWYLRYDQRSKVSPLPGNVDPVRDAAALRFRFPWPDEDAKNPGDFEDYGRGIGVTVDFPWMRESIDHYTVQFINAEYGLNVCLPCPEGAKAMDGVKIHRNGYRGNVVIRQQRLHEGRLVIVCECGSCGAAFRLPDWESAMPVVEAIKAKAEFRCEVDDAGFYRQIAKRIADGYGVA
jgi:hypothetical protein